MVKEHTHTELFQRCSVKEFFQVLYADSCAAKDFHKEVDKDENTQVDPWQGNSRTVHFTMPMQLPAVIGKLIDAGTDTIPVKEVQQAEMDSDGSLQITSTPIIGVPGGSKFQAVARLTITNTHVSGVYACQVVARVTCTADGPWGLQGMIESIMVEQSAASVKGYLSFCKARCEARAVEQEGDAELQGSPRSDATAFEQFFDAQETMSRLSSMASSQGLSLAAYGDEVVDTVALLQLLDTLDGRLGLLASDLAAVRALLPPRDGRSSLSPPRPAAAGPGASLAPLLLGFALGAAAAAAASYAVLRRQGRL